MGNSVPHKIFHNIDIAMQIFKLLNFEDQFNIRAIDQQFHDVILENIQNHKVTMQTHLARYDNEDLLEYLKQWGQSFQSLTITAYAGEHFSWKPMKILLNLTEISLTYISIYVHDIYWMAKELKNLQNLKLHLTKILRLSADSVESDFECKSIKKLQIPAQYEIFRLIRKCTNLQELRIVNAPRTIIYHSFSNQIFSMDNLKSKLKSFELENNLRSLDRQNHFNIIAKPDNFLEIDLHSIIIKQQIHLDMILKQKLVHLRALKAIRMDSPTTKSFNILVNNCQQLSYLRICHTPKEFHLSKLKTLKYLYITDSVIAIDSLHSIVNNLSLTALRLKCRSYKQDQKNILKFSTNFCSTVNHLRFDRFCDCFEQFFVHFPEIFKNLKQITFFEIDISSDVFEFLTAQIHWNLKRLIFDHCHIEFEMRSLLLNQNDSKPSIESIMMYDCMDIHGLCLQHILAQNRIKYLYIFESKRFYDIEMINKIASPLDFNINLYCSSSNTLRSITLDNLTFSLNDDFWYSYMGKVNQSLLITIHNACKSYLYKLFSKKLLRPKLKSIEYKNIEGEVDLDQQILSSLPLTITTLDYRDYCELDFFESFRWNLKSVLVIHLSS